MSSHIDITPAFTDDSCPSTPSIPMLKALETSRLAGLTFENARGRHICLYWQASTSSEFRGGDIMESTFIQRGPSWKFQDTAVVSQGAKENTPLAAICWANGQQRAVYYLSVEWNLIEERLYDAGTMRNEWNDGDLTLLKVAPRTNSSLAASFVTTGLNDKTINLYYQDWTNEIRELERTSIKNEWRTWNCGTLKSFRALSGTSIACTACVGRRWVYTVQTDRHMMEHLLWEPQKEAIHGGKDFMLGTFDHDDTMTSTSICPGRLKLYINNGNSISAKIYDGGWNFRKTLPDTGSMLPKRTFVTLGWGSDIDNPFDSHQTHMFAMRSDGTMMYSLVEAPGIIREFSITGTDIS